MARDDLDRLTDDDLLVAVLTDPSGVFEAHIWETRGADGRRTRALVGPGHSGPPTPDCPRVGPVAFGPDGHIAFASTTPDLPALGLRSTSGGVTWVPAPAPVLGIAWSAGGPLVRVALQPGQDPTAPAPPRPSAGGARVRTYATRPVRDWDHWRTEHEPALLLWDGEGWQVAWHGARGQRLVAHACHPSQPGFASVLRTRGSDGLDHDTLDWHEGSRTRRWMRRPATTVADLHAGAWGLTWTEHTRPGSGFGGPVAARCRWGGTPTLLSSPGGPWQVGHGFVGTRGEVLVTIARDGRQLLQRLGPDGSEDLAHGVTQACGHDGGWVGVQGGIGRRPRRVTHRAPVDTRSRSLALAVNGSRVADGTHTASWIVHAGAPEPRPTLLWVHGGPLSQWADTWHPRWNPEPFVERGYTVLMPNPRGSLGRGRAFRDAAGGNRWGEGPIDDLLAAVDAAAAHPAVDPRRVAVLGASFGGWAAAWLAATTRRFRCAVVHAAPTHLAALHGDTDVPGFLEAHMGGVPRAGAEADRWSPVHRVAGWATPTLITHGEQDMRVPVGQAIALYQALHRAGGDTALRVYPDAHHWLTRPADMLDWHRAVFAFLDRHLSPGAQR